MTLTTAETAKLKNLSNESLQASKPHVTRQLKAEKRLAACQFRLEWIKRETAKGTGIFFTGLLTKYKKMFISANSATEKACKDLEKSVEAIDVATDHVNAQLKYFINQGGHPRLDEEINRLSSNLKLVEKQFVEAEEAYKSAKAKEKLVYEATLKYMADKEVMKEKETDKYKTWKIEMGKQIKSLSESDN